ncbi:two-component system, OmpR family, sensor histidine kinase BaeS [Prauserella aidingensis]|uniref:sensor histidine kinase n=1 Tax=Prauserella aidingensis TaxID=387890 RepID=UPI0020A29AE5|nr:ATP-binding protein [Prauserella aidingensis]MCP2254167.1 two-component system, OmpR family, sensor histidine kinase BaeS [Prauserella aidingensis]
MRRRNDSDGLSDGRRKLGRHSLLTRLLALAAVVACASIGATAWLAAQSTSGAINRELRTSLAHDATIYDSLLGYAATHARWRGVQDTVDRLADETGRRITLTTPARVPIADSGGHDRDALPRTPSAVVDPLAVDTVLKPDATASGIDPRAVGPYRLTAGERRKLREAARSRLACLRRHGVDGTIVERPNGRSTVEPVTATSPPPTAETRAPERPSRDGTRSPASIAQLPRPATGSRTEPPTPSPKSVCGPEAAATRTERTANEALLTLVDACLERQGRGPLPVDASDITSAGELTTTGSHTKRCVDSARREQLASHVSPAAQLFITAPNGDGAGPDLSTVGVDSIVWTAATVLAVTIGVAALAASRLVRPIRAITAAAKRMGDGDRSARAETSARGEIGELATAFNSMSERIERSERQRRTLVSDVAHELRTPLGNVRGWLEAAQDGVADLDPQLVASLHEETLLLQHLIDDLQDLALADAGKLHVHLEPVDLRALVEQVVAAHRAAADNGGVELSVHADDDAELSADPTRLRQSLGNLVSNAVRHTPRGGRVELRAQAIDDELRIDVTDTGTGIDAESLPHVFDRFWRAEKSRSRSSGGSGLGLAITHHLITAHGGRIAVRSTVGVGTVFTVHLPIRHTAED